MRERERGGGEGGRGKRDFSRSPRLKLESGILVALLVERRKAGGHVGWPRRKNQAHRKVIILPLPVSRPPRRNCLERARPLS